MNHYTNKVYFIIRSPFQNDYYYLGILSDHYNWYSKKDVDVVQCFPTKFIARIFRKRWIELGSIGIWPAYTMLTHSSIIRLKEIE